jgi:hypothetical protein
VKYIASQRRGSAFDVRAAVSHGEGLRGMARYFAGPELEWIGSFSTFLNRLCASLSPSV